MAPGGRPPGPRMPKMTEMREAWRQLRQMKMNPFWPPLIWRPKDPEMREAWSRLRMNTLNVWLLVSLGLSLMLLWPIITIIRQGFVDPLSTAIFTVLAVAQALSVYGVTRWRDHTRRVEKKGSDRKSGDAP